MHVLITGAAGFIGTKLFRTLANEGEIGGDPITSMTLCDIADIEYDTEDSVPFDVKIVKTDIATSAASALFQDKPELIFHLAAVLSGESEKDMDKGYRTNIDGTRNLLECIRSVGNNEYKPRLVFSSSIAVFGGPPFPDVLDDTYNLTPQTSYGTAKAIAERLIDDYSRRGFVDGVSIRFPTITVRPGLPGGASTNFFSGIIREPLRGLEVICPVPGTFRHCVASPRSAIRYLLYAAKVSAADLAKTGATRAITMPGLEVTIDDMIKSLGRVTGKGAVKLIKMEPNEKVLKMLSTFHAGNFDFKRATDLGFVLSDSSFDDVICAYIYDDLGGHKYSLPPEVLGANRTTDVTPTHISRRGKAA